MPNANCTARGSNPFACLEGLWLWLRPRRIQIARIIEAQIHLCT